jgi:flagellar biosynthesis protein FlhF
MLIKRYIVNNMNEAMTRIRYELGKDAVIISQRKIRKPGLAGFFSKKMIEVTAAVENQKKPEEPSIQSSIDAIKLIVDKDRSTSGSADSLYDRTGKKSTSAEAPDIEGREERAIPDTQASNLKEEKAKGLSEDIMKEMQEMKELLNSMTKTTPAKSPRKSKLQTMLEKSDLNEKLVKKVLSTVKNTSEEEDELVKARRTIEKLIPLSKAKLEDRIVLVGPTGVGKTTTIAKLAGRLSLIEKKKVGLITIDTYRIGAVEQLRTYAEIMNLPFKVVLTIKEMETAIESMTECDVILIDTTGRSSKNAMQISELRAFVEKANTENIHLVLSCTTKNSDAESIIEGFKELNYNSVIITKLDETSSYGSIVNILDSAKKPLSFITTGQNVPDDIKQLTAAEVCNLVLGEDKIC